MLQVPVGGEEAALELAVVGTAPDFDFQIRLVAYCTRCLPFQDTKVAVSLSSCVYWYDQTSQSMTAWSALCSKTYDRSANARDSGLKIHRQVQVLRLVAALQQQHRLFLGT